MRKIILLMHVSLDGFAGGPSGEMDWIGYNSELESYVHTLHDSTDAAIYGRATYDMMQTYWPTVLTNPDSTASEKNHARWYDAATKVIVSRTLHSDPALRRVVVGQNLAAEMQAVKQQPGQNLWLIGSPSVSRAFIELDLIDEYWLNVNPVILGSGLPTFGETKDRLGLKLISSQTFAGGVVGLRYERDRS
ncbi:MAG: dihydrofolate reductase family protein [Anaerolineae bacterium]|nr:dihydrofolate reductase family protein [Anaerolineae bacterium]